MTKSLGEAAKQKTGWILAPLIAFGLLAALLGYALTIGDPSKLPSALIGRPAPVTDFPSLANLHTDGRDIPGFKTSWFNAQTSPTESAAPSQHNKVRIVNFWASWCGPCIIEHPHIVTLANHPDVTMYGVSYKDKPSDIRRYLKRYGNPYFALGTDADGRGAIDWGVSKVPETFIINARGEVTYKHEGPITPKALKQKILPAIEAAKTSN